MGSNVYIEDKQHCVDRPSAKEVDQHCALWSLNESEDFFRVRHFAYSLSNILTIVFACKELRLLERS